MFSPRFIKLLPATASALMAVAMFVQMKAWAFSDAATDYHQMVKRAASAIPVRHGEWEGTDIAVPQPAARLLRPNVLFARHYESNRRGLEANLVFVQCTDARDMNGHYPPNCYPSSGWVLDKPGRAVQIPVGRTTIPAMSYEFTRSEFGAARRSLVYNFFILPSGFATTMAEVTRVSGDQRWRSLGAAQVQVILDSSLPETTRLDIASELLEPLVPIIDTLQVRRQGDRP